jgi:transketolase C-terminal domain/subunit
VLDINLFRYCQGVIDFDAEIPDRAFDLGMAEQS